MPLSFRRNGSAESQDLWFGCWWGMISLAPQDLSSELCLISEASSRIQPSLSLGLPGWLFLITAVYMVIILNWEGETFSSTLPVL